MPKNSRLAMIQSAQARLLRSAPRRKHKEPDADEKGGPSDMDSDDSLKFKRTGSIASAGASVGGGT